MLPQKPLIAGNKDDSATVGTSSIERAQSMHGSEPRATSPCNNAVTGAPFRCCESLTSGDRYVMDPVQGGAYADGMPPTPPKLTASLAGGLSILALQAVTAPFALIGLTSGGAATPRWLTAMYAGLEAAAIASAMVVAWGLRAKRTQARFAPAVLLLPFWVAVAVGGPIVYAGALGLLFAGFALCVGAITSLPLAMPRARAAFAPASVGTSSLSLTTTAEV